MGNCIRCWQALPWITSLLEDSETPLMIELRASSGCSPDDFTTTAECSSIASTTPIQPSLVLGKLQHLVKQLARDRESRQMGYLERKHGSEMASRLKEINNMIAMAYTLDVAFLFDATDSMQPYLDSVKTRIAAIAQRISAVHPECTMRVGFAIYRDYDEKERCQSCDFTSSFNGPRSVFVKALSCVRAVGGGDVAEDVFSGLERVAALSWKGGNRIVFHIADAPCHGKRFHKSNVSDQYPNGDRLGRSATKLLLNLRDGTNVSCYYFLHINRSTKKMLREFRKEAGDDWIQEDQFDKDILSKVASACSKTVSKTLRGMATGRSKFSWNKPIPCPVRPIIPDWTLISPEEGQQYKYKWYDNLEELLSKLSSGRSLALELIMDPVRVRIAPLPFSNEGAMRWPYYAELVAGEGLITMVMKRFKNFPGVDTRKVHAKERYLEQMEVQSVAAQMAQQFNILTQGFSDVKQVTFAEVSTVEVGGIGHTTRFFNMEELSGKWIRYFNNPGYVNTKAYAITLQAFSHWTHVYSKGLFIVTDLQGVKIQNGLSHESYEFQLYDPAIHCKDLTRFTRTNLGEYGFQLFYKSHKCSNVCKKLGLPKSKNGYTMVKVPKTSMGSCNLGCLLII